MTLNRVLALTSMALGALLVTQVAFENMSKEPVRVLRGSWVNNADTAADGVDQSDHVIQAEVIGLAKGPDLVVPASDEPDGVDTVPTTIVTLQVVKSYKGDKQAGDMVELLQTGGGTDAVQLPAPPEADDVSQGNTIPPGRGTAKKARPEGTSPSSPAGPTSKESRATILEDDPPYQPGEKYILFTKNIDEGLPNPEPLAGLNAGTVRAFAPEGRYQVTKQNRLKPGTTKKGFAPNWQGKPVAELEAAIRAATGTP